MTLKNLMDAIYTDLSLDDIPWNFETPPDILVDLVESGSLTPCDAVDLGCGAGNYAVWLATRGFAVTGIDVSARAIQLATRLASAKGVKCRFVVADLLGDLEPLRACFDFAFDWEVLHHVFPEQRGRYVQNVHSILRPGGRYLSVCFAEADAVSFGGSGKYRETRLGTTLYFSSQEELRDLFLPLFDIQELCEEQIEGRSEPHIAFKALMTRKPDTGRHLEGEGPSAGAAARAPSGATT